MREQHNDRFGVSLGFPGQHLISSIGKSGGLALLWKQPLDVHVWSTSRGHIDCVIKDQEKIWRFMGFYGNPDTNLRWMSWDLLRKLHAVQELRLLPWLVAGDYNEICFQREKSGGRPRSTLQMEAFREALLDCELRDIHTEGEFYTWASYRGTNSLILERLDKYTSSFEWRILYPNAQAQTLGFYHSDHRPVLMTLGNIPDGGETDNSNQRRPFRFETMWLRENDCEEIVAKGWNSTDLGTALQFKMNACSQELMAWAKIRFRNRAQKIKMGHIQVEDLKRDSQWESSIHQINLFEHELAQIESHEELYWQQRSRNQ
ncbi:uncharacterized protein [Primulina eburnea]|uniref:uncharacterized protein n=1 Tax=Primulina eburnea TaxID=1245227 RepID=UPI003C6BFE1D